MVCEHLYLVAAAFFALCDPGEGVGVTGFARLLLTAGCSYEAIQDPETQLRIFFVLTSLMRVGTRELLDVL